MSPTNYKLENLIQGVSVPDELKDTTIYSTNASAQDRKMEVTVVSTNSKYVYNEQTGYGKIKEDVIVYSVSAGSICEQVGLQVNDCVKGLIINGTTYFIDRNFHIGDLLLKVKAGDVIAFSITREGSDITTTSNYTVQQTDPAKA